MERKSNILPGVLLIVFGLLLLIPKYLLGFEFLSFSDGDFWPIFVLGLGLFFELAYFATGRMPGLLVPGGILTTISLLFYFEVGTDWAFSSYTWPVYIFSVALGLFQLYAFGKRNMGALLIGLILTTVAVLASLSMLYRITFIPVLRALWRLFDISFGNVDAGLILPIALIVIGSLMFLRKDQPKARC